MLLHDGSYKTRSPQPWRDYADALIEAKEAADRNAVLHSAWPTVLVHCYKWHEQQLAGIETDAGGPDLTALPDWPKLLAALRKDMRHGTPTRQGACEKLFAAAGWTAQEASESEPMRITPPRPLFGSNLQVRRTGLTASWVTGGARLKHDDVIIGLDGVAITRGAAQLHALIAATPPPCGHTFVVRRRDAKVYDKAAAEAALEALEQQSFEPPCSADTLTAHAAASDEHPLGSAAAAEDSRASSPRSILEAAYSSLTSVVLMPVQLLGVFRK